MPDKASNLGQFWQELKRRKVVRVIIVYAAAAYAILELTDMVAPSLGLPDWTLNFIIVLLCVGFIITVIVSWVYDITPEGIEKTKPAIEATEKAPEKPSVVNAWKIGTYISVVIIIGLIIFHTTGERKQSSDISKLEKSIAVLPFDNMSTDEEYSHLGDAITDEIILELQKIKEFDRVLSRSSTMQFRDSRPTVPEIAKKLGVNYIIEGSIQRHEEDVSIRIQVLRSNPEDHVWGDEYNGRWEDIFSIQDEIAFKVAKELKIVLSPLEMGQIEKKPTYNLEAYNLYLKGNYHWQMQTNEGYNHAMEYFEQAIQKDPDFALAFIGIAIVHLQYAFYGNVSPNVAYPKIKKYVQKAMELDNTLAEAYTMLGNINRLYDWNWKEAEKNYKKALQLNPNSANTHLSYAFILAITERYDESLTEAKKAQVLDPLSSWLNVNVGWLYIMDKQFDKAIEELTMTNVMDPNYWAVHNNLGLAYVGKCMIEEAIVEFERAFALSDDNTFIMALLANAYYHIDQKKEGDELYHNLQQRSKHEYIPPMCFCWIHKARGEMDLFYECLEQACNEHDSWLPWFRFYSVDRYRIPDEPMYNELLKKAGLV